MDILHHGDCFLFDTSIISYDYFPGIHCRYRLSSQVNETECNYYYCPRLGSRFFTKKFSELIKSEHLQTALKPKDHELTEEAVDQMKLNLNIKHFGRLLCRLYKPYGKDYLRYRG